jgi:vacuolar iron transporter family protein
MHVNSKERHRTGRISWLRAAVLGANDGILSTSSLVLGVAAAHATHSNVMVAGVAGLVAGAMSMAAGISDAGTRFARGCKALLLHHLY